MISKLKYIVIENDSVIIFPFNFDHSYMARDFNVISAGKINIYQGYFPKGWNSEQGVPDPQIAAIHGSFTLGIEFDKERCEKDQKLIEKLLRPGK